MSRRRTLDETRLIILEAAAELVSEAGLSVSTGDLSMIDACRRAGLSTAGSAYKIWPDQKTFRVDALRHLLDRGTNLMLDFGELIDFTDPDGVPSFDETIRILGEASVDHTVGTTDFDLFVALWSASRSDPALGELIRLDEKRIAEQMGPIYEAALDFYGREMIPPFTVSALTVLFASLTDGLAMHGDWVAEEGLDALKRPTGPDGAEQSWHVMGCAVQAIVYAFTRPKGDTASGEHGEVNPVS